MLLPEPLRPTIPKNSPWWTSKEMPRSARSSRYSIWRSGWMTALLERVDPVLGDAEGLLDPADLDHHRRRASWRSVTTVAPARQRREPPLARSCPGVREASVAASWRPPAAEAVAQRPRSSAATAIPCASSLSAAERLGAARRAPAAAAPRATRRPAASAARARSARRPRRFAGVSSLRRSARAAPRASTSRAEVARRSSRRAAAAQAVRGAASRAAAGARALTSPKTAPAC